MRNQKHFFLPAFGCLITSTILLTLPGSAFPKENWLNKIWIDKWVHIGMFSIIVISVCWGWYKGKTVPGKLKLYFILIGVVCLGYGVAMEFVQKYWIPNRSFDMGDIVADGLGSIAGVIFSFKRYIKK